MLRFEIQDIASQNQDGVTFRALDKSTSKIVSLRRFFPFGQDEEGGEGLSPQEGKAFSSACQKLSRVSHPALRKTIYGDTDPIDGMPYLVTEWIDGLSLSDVLGANSMDPSMIIGLVRQAIDVCMTLSNTLENEAVWIDTKLEAIIVSNPEVDPTFSFRICPFKWLGTQSHQKDLTGMVSMVEALMGWKSKLVSDQAGLGLGGWIKMLRQNPEMSLKAALDCLPGQNIEQPATEPKVTTYIQPVQPYIVLPSAKQSLFTKKSVTIMAISACITAALIFFLYQNKQKQQTSNEVVPTELQPPVEDIKIENEVVEPADDANPKKNEDSEKITQEKAEIATPKPQTTSTNIKLWSPAEISTAAWYDASNAASITANNGLVSQWNDISGNNNHATQSTSALQPRTGTRTINNLNAIDFDSNILSRIELNMADKAIFAVVLTDNTGDGGQIFSHSKINNQLRLIASGRINYAASPSRYLNNHPSSASLTLNKPGIAGFILNKTLEYSVNGVFEDTGVSEDISISSAFDQFGARGENAEALDGLIGEIIITDSIPDSDARLKIEGYLAHKWSLTQNLPTDHPYKLSAPTSSSSEPENLKSLPKTKSVPPKLETAPPKPKAEPPKTEPIPPKITLWSPTDIPSTAWFDASTATFKDGTVSIINAGSNGGGTISGPASLVANGIGNLQSVQFNGSSQYLTGDIASKGTTLTVFFVGKSLNTTQAPYAGMMSVWENSQMYDWNNAGSAVLFSQNNTLANSIYTHRNSMILSSSTGTLTTGFLATTVFNGSTHTLYLNGTPSTGIASTDSFNANKVILGARWQKSAIAGPFWNGNFGEAIICNTDLSTSDRQKIEGYLAHKWGLTGELPADHPYKLSSPEPSVSKTDTVKNSPLTETDLKQQKTPAPKATLWSPTEIALTAWYDAADTSTITSSRDRVSQWNDKSGGAKHLKMARAVNQPTYGNSTVVFKLDDRLESDATNMSTFVGPALNKCAAFAVIKYISGDVLMQIESDITNRFGLEGNNRFDFPNDTAGKLMGWSKPISNSVFTIVAATANGTTQTAHVNGTLVASKANSLSITDAKGARFALGAQAGGGVPSALEVQELIFLDSVSDQDRQKIEGYLAHKWGLTGNLPADHPYKSSAPGAKPQVLDVLTPQNSDYIKTLKVGDPVTLQGVVKSAKFSTTGKSIYLSFSDPDVETDIRVVIHGSEYDGTAFTEEEFAKLLEKNLVFNGTVYTESFNDRPPFVKITEKAQIKLATKSADKPNDTEKPNNIPVFTPNDAASLAKLNIKDPVSVRGIVKSVKIPKPGGGLYFSFSDPLDRRQIQVLTYPKSFDNGHYDSAAFKKIEEEYQNLVGKTVTFNGSVTRQKDNNVSQFVFISKREHIVVEETKDKSESNLDKPIEKPNKKGPIDNLNPGTRIIINGNVKTVEQNSDGMAIIISFFDSKQNAPLRGVAYKNNYKDPFDIKKFESFVGKPVSINGVLVVDKNDDRFIEITNLNQISIIQK